MDENWAAVIVSLVTGGFGLLGIIVTQAMAKLKARRIQPGEKDIMGASEGLQNLPRIDYLATMQREIRQEFSLMKDGQYDIMAILRDLKHQARDNCEDIRNDIERLERGQH